MQRELTDQEVVDQILRLWPNSEIVRVKGMRVDSDIAPVAVSIHLLTGNVYRVVMGVGDTHSEALRDCLRNAQAIQSRRSDDSEDRDLPF